jgi:hypothetical protein
VLRGGAWNNNQNNARCANRNRNNPNNRNNNMGFRVVVSHIFSLACRQYYGLAPNRGGCVVEAKEMARPDAWPALFFGVGRIYKSHTPSGSLISEGWGVASVLQGKFFCPEKSNDPKPFPVMAQLNPFQ